MAKLTNKQKKALRRAPKRAKAALARNFGRQRNSDASALRGIKQGVGRTVPRPFGSTAGYHPSCHDAFHMSHLPLPRPTGPYSVVRTTETMDSSLEVIFLGPTFDDNKGQWHSTYAIGAIDAALSVGTASNTYFWHFSQLKTGSWNGAQITPSAFSVQIMNPNAIQTTSGILYMGRIRTALKLSQSTNVSYNAIARACISYNNPRLCSAAKLSFRGVQVDLVPFNMSELANFTAALTADNGRFTFSDATEDFTGFAPMFIYNPGKVNLQLLVCCEWRTRFDPTNPAQATHVQHQHAPESLWARAMHGAEAIGNGVVDIAERVANTGNAIYNGMGATFRVARGARALMGAARAPLALM